MNEITIEEFDALSPESYLLYDIRSTEEINHGAIKGAIASSAEELEENPPEEKDKKIIICCSRGRVSRDVAEALCEQGYDAVSLKGGYITWLMAEIKKQEADEICDSVEKSLRKKFHKTIFSKFAKAINQYELVKEGDRIAVCISGGKDSMLMAKLFQELKKHNKFPFEVKFLVMDPGYSPENRKVIEENARKLKIPIEIFESDIFDAVYTIEKSPCYLCARMRRGHLYTFAKQLGCNKIALGHHYDDVIETILMGMLYGAQVQDAKASQHQLRGHGAHPPAVSGARGRH
jgi:tRNA 2-thiocytidine biosynthesis protein TtcA